MIDNIFYSRKNGYYYFTGVPVCDMCNETFTYGCFHKGVYSKREKIEGVYCEKCISKIKIKGTIENNFFCLLRDEDNLPMDAVRFIPQPAEIKNGKITNYDLSEINAQYKNDTNNDYDFTRFALKTEFSKLDINDKSPVLKGGRYNDSSYLQKLERENNLDLQAAKKLLNELKEAKPIMLGEQEKNFIEFSEVK